VDYGLAPANTYPTALNEIYKLYQWLQDPNNLTSIGIPAVEGRR
jgi:acetyl esterase/lipase